MIFLLASFLTSILADDLEAIDLLFETQKSDSNQASFAYSLLKQFQSQNAFSDEILKLKSKSDLRLNQLQLDLEQANNYISETNRRLQHNAQQIPGIKEKKCNNNYNFINELSKMKKLQEGIGNLKSEISGYFNLGESEYLQSDIEVIFEDLANSIQQTISAHEQREIKVAGDFVRWQMEIQKESAQMLDEIQRKLIIVQKIQQDIQFQNDYMLQLEQVIQDSSSLTQTSQQYLGELQKIIESDKENLVFRNQGVQEAIYVYKTQYNEFSQYTRNKMGDFSISKNQVRRDEYDLNHQIISIDVKVNF